MRVTIRATLESIIDRLRPFRLKTDDEFVLPDGTPLFAAGVSRPAHSRGRSGNDVVVLTAKPVSGSGIRREALQCAGAVLVRPETREERAESRACGLGPQHVIQGYAPETRDFQGRVVVYPIAGAVTRFPILVTGI